MMSPASTPNDATREVFNATAATYDADRARLIPCFDRFYAAAIEQIPADAQRIVDLGAGTGLLTAFVRSRFPHAQIFAVDSSEPMLARARQRLANDLNTHFLVADYTTAPMPENVDAIVSALSIHHLEHPAKQRLFDRIHAALKPGGVFINAEQVLGPTAVLEERYKQRWLAQVRSAGATAPQIADSLFRQQQDRCASVEDQIAWLRASGFPDADCAFKDGRFAVFTATRP